MTGENIPQGVSRELSGPMDINPALKVSQSVALWGQQPDRPLTTRQDHDAINVWYERNGGAVSQSNEGYDVTTDSTQSGSEAVIETARLGVYRPGVLASTGAGVYIEDRPTGDGKVEIGYSMDGDPDGVSHRITSDDFLGVFENEVAGQSFTVSRSAGEWDPDAVTEKTDSNGDTIAYVYGYDPVDGTGPSTVDWSPGHGYVYGFLLGWYGPSSTVAYLKATREYNSEWSYGITPLYMVEPVGTPLFESPNRPMSVRAENGTTAEQVRARILGRQFELGGAITKQSAPIWATAVGQSLPEDGTGTGDRDWYVVAVARRKTDGKYNGTAIGLEDFEITSTNEPLTIHARTVDPQYLSNVTYQSPVDIAESQTPLEIDMTSDTTTRVSLDSFEDSDGNNKPQGVSWKGDMVGAAAKNTPSEGDLEGSLSFPFVRNYPTVWLARTRTGTSDEVDVNLQAQVIG